MSDAATCSPAWRRRVAAYHDGGLPGPERASVEEHLRDCPDCQRLLSAYDKIYRDLRAMPGFEGLLTITKPGTRRGLGSTSRPVITWPGKNSSSVAGPGHERMRRSNGGGPIVVTLVLLLALAALVARTTNLLSPLAVIPTPNTSVVATSLPLPTFAPFAADGSPCANRGQGDAFPYLFTDAHNRVMSVTGCEIPQQIAAIPITDYQIGALSPDNAQMLVFAPAVPNRKAGQITHLYLLTLATGAWRDITPHLAGVTYSADEAGWIGTANVIVRSGNRVLDVNLIAPSVALLSISATHIETREFTLFYSTVSGGKAALHALTRDTNAKDTMVLPLGAGVATCATPGCWQSIPWDVSADGTQVVYPTPVPAAPPTAAPQMTTLMVRNIGVGTQTSLGTLALTATPWTFTLAPNERAVAVSGQDANGSHIIAVYGTGSQSVLSMATDGACAWRPDSAALVVMPFAPDGGHTPQLLTTAGTTAPLLPLTANYLWEN